MYTFTQAFIVTTYLDEAFEEVDVRAFTSLVQAHKWVKKMIGEGYDPRLVVTGQD